MNQLNVQNQKGSIKLAIFIAFFLVMLSAIGVFGYSYIFQYEVVNFKNVPGISSNTRQQKGILYEVAEDVIYYPNRSDRPYVFMVTPKNVKIFGPEPVTIEGTSADFNRLINEMIFVTRKYGSKLSYAKECGKGGIDAIKNMVTGFIEIFKHPIKALKGVGKLGKEIYRVSIEIIDGNLKFQDIKDSVSDFAENYWFDYKCRQTEKYGFDYRKIVFPISKTIVDNHCVARISGEGAVEVATVFVGFLKIAKMNKTSWLAKIKGSNLSTIFKYTKKGKVRKPEVIVGESGKYKNLALIKKAQKGVKSVATPHWITKGIEISKQLYYKVKWSKVSKKTHRERRAEFNNKTRPEFWKQEAEKNPKKWSRENHERMKKGNAPLDENGNAYELHHVRPLEYGGKNKPDNLVIMRKEPHRYGTNKRKNHTPPFKSKEKFIEENGIKDLNA